MAELKPAYLICGDDDAKIDAWRGRVRRRAEAERGPGGLETIDARDETPESVAAALATLSFDPGTRYVMVDDAGAWKAAQLGPLEGALAAMPPETVLVLVVRGAPLKAVVTAVEGTGGEVREYRAPKPWELPAWASERARELGVELDKEGARALVAAAGPSQQRIARELEKLAIAVHPARSAGAPDVDAVVAGGTPPPVYDLADALVAGDLETTLAIGDRLIEGDERPGGLVYPLARALRQVHAAIRLVEGGAPEKDAAAALGMPPWLAKKTLAKARGADRAALERAICALADLELDLRGESELDERSAFSLALARAAA